MSKVKITAKSCYAPIRFEAKYSEFADVLKRDVKQIKSMISQALSTDEIIDSFYDENSERKQFLISKGFNPDWDIWFELADFACYTVAGKVIYDIEPILLEAFNITDIMNINMGEFELPASCFYIHLGNYSNVFDGVFVFSDDLECYGTYAQEVRFEFVYSHFAKTKEKAIVSTMDSNDLAKEVLSLDFYDNETSLYNAIETELQNKLELALQYFYTEDEYSRNEIEDFRISTQESFKELKRCMQIVFNTILYINARSQDIQEDWGRDVPKKKIAQIHREPNNAIKKNLEQGLTERGYTKVRYIGRQFSQTSEGKELNNQELSDKTLATHFRRGHFRNQRYGEKNSLSKIIFIPPTIVNANGVMQGKVYKLS